MGTQMLVCCQPALVNDISDVRAPSLLALIAKFKQEEKTDGTKSKLKLESIDSSKCRNDGHGLECIKISESWTSSADDELEEAVIRDILHEKDILHSKKSDDFVESGLDLNELYIKTTLIKPFQSTSISKGYDLSSPPIPTPIAINWSNSHITSLDINAYDEEESLDIDDMECISIELCPSIKRIINALKWYSIYGIDHETIYNKMEINNYGKQIMNDYNHIIDYHLNIDIKYEYNLILNEINKYVEPCNFIKCGGYQRYLRSRNGNVHQHEMQIYVNTMDGIHSCFMHLTKTFNLN